MALNQEFQPSLWLCRLETKLWICGRKPAKKDLPMVLGTFLKQKTDKKPSAQKSLLTQLFYINVISNPHVLIFCDTSTFPLVLNPIFVRIVCPHKKKFFYCEEKIVCPPLWQIVASSPGLRSDGSSGFLARTKKMCRQVCRVPREHYCHFPTKARRMTDEPSHAEKSCFFRRKSSPFFMFALFL